jgi:regulation of enolase protein 1 (concanavalin A-like superfamily)
LNEPENCNVVLDSSKLPTQIRFRTSSETDLWQKTYYGFKHDNAHSFLCKTKRNFTFCFRTTFVFKSRFDQCGVVIYQSSQSWAKASIEYENESIGRLGSVVTNFGYSDWATSDIENRRQMFYRLSRRGPDFLFETSVDGNDYRQLRVFHLHSVGDTQESETKSTLPDKFADTEINFGVYACSPTKNASFNVEFDQISFQDCLWQAHNE